MRYFLLLILLPLSTFAAQPPDIDEQNARCTAALDKAKTYLQAEATRLANLAAATPPAAVDAASNQPITTGNPITDSLANLGKAQGELAQAQQQKLQAQAQIDNECFQQAEDISDKCHDIRQKEPDRLRQINMAEGEKKKQESEIRLACWKEASTLYQGEMARMTNYQERIVSTVSGATRSKLDINQLRTRFYNQCYSSPATQEALRSCKGDLDIKMRNFELMATEFASDLEYHENTKMNRLSKHCNLRQEQVDAQFAPMRNAAIQQIALGAWGVKMAMETASASTEGQQKVRDTYGSYDQILSNWTRITQNCTNLHTASTSDANIDQVPSDVYEVMRPIHDACRTSEASANIQCFKSTGVLSTDKQKANRATSSQ
jgi:hypothetical protein